MPTTLSRAASLDGVFGDVIMVVTSFDGTDHQANGKPASIPSPFSIERSPRCADRSRSQSRHAIPSALVGP